MKALKLNGKEESVIKELVKRIKLLLGNKLALLELFGSKARGDSTKDSDIDLLLVVKEKSLQLRRNIYDILFELDPYYELKISILIYSKAEYQKNEELRSSFIENLEKEAVVL